MESSNPFMTGMKDKISARSGAFPMTIGGIIAKLGALMIPLAAAFLYTYQLELDVASMASGIAALVGFIIALIVIFNPTSTVFLAPFYAICEGVALGGISRIVDVKYPGAATQATLATMGVFLTMLVIYGTGLIKVTEKFIAGVLMAMVGLLVIYLSDLILGFFGIQLPVVNSSSPMGIAFSVGVVVLAAVNLLIDFHYAEEAVERRDPKYMEWYCAFGMLVTLVWLYLEILRLISKVRGSK